MNIKKTYISFSCVIIFAVSFVLIASAMSNIKLKASVPAVKSMPKVIIDAGHGGEDGGAVNNDGVLEKNINLTISNDTADLLKLLGFEVQQTRTSDISLSNDEATTRERKVADMQKRLEIFNSSERNVVISIHQNKFDREQYSGTQVFFSPNNANSKILAENIKFSVKAQLQNNNERECKQADSSIFLLNNATTPAVIVECGFISNYNECQKLLSNTYQKQMSYAIVTGFLDYYNSN